ncbi:MAG: purple acid phosphatase family protein [Myxococcota bacterium]
MQKIFILSIIFLFYIPVVYSAPKYLRLSYTDDTSTTINITWNTDADTDTVVRFGKQSKNYTQRVNGTSFKANDALNYIHEVKLTVLEPSTTYYYIAGSDTDGFSNESSFTTGPIQDENCATFSFGYLGDNRPDPTFGGGENWPQILDQCAAHNPDFIINGGDLVIDGDKIDQWIKFLGWTEKVASRIPFMPTIGNHDDGPGSGDAANYNQIFALPRSSGNYGSNTEDYYYFTYGNAIFISISTQTFRDGTIPFERQARWLDEVLTHNPRKWKFVYFHHPIYTKNVVFDISHPPNEVNQNAALVPVFDKHHIDIVFTSHNHWYERYEPSACANAGKPSSDNPCSVGANNFDKGTVYVVSGGAGAFTIPAVLCGMQAGRVKCSGDHHYIIITIKNETLTFEAYSAYPQQNKLMDSFTITKAKNNCVLSPDAGYEDVSEDIRTDAETIDIGTIDILDTSYTDSNLSDIIFQKDEVFYEDIPDFALYDNIAEDLEEVDTKTFDTIEKTDIITQDIIGGDILIKGDEAMGGAEESKGCGCNVLE